MSGGVDSSVAAALLKKQGYDVIGVFMHFWAENLPAPSASRRIKGGDSGADEATNKCCSVAAFNDARRVAQKLDFPLYTLNFDLPFKKLIVDEFLKSYQTGLTPNPCVNCNQFIKFDLLLKKARDLGADYLATGHYAKIKKSAGRWRLYRPKDKEKDQTYFLYTLSAEKLKRLIFPLADLTKPEVRALAKKFKLPVAQKRESQEICFIVEKDHYGFLKRYLKLKPGEIRLLTSPLPPPRSASWRSTPPGGEKKEVKGEGGHLTPSLRRRGKGEVVGRHQGLPLYTIGQRKGVEIGGNGPFYVARLNYKTNTLYVVNRGDHPALYKKELTTKNLNWLGGTAPKAGTKIKAVIRYRHKEVDATIKKWDNNSLKLFFSEPQRAITPGQSAVFYKNKEVLGGGIIV